MYYSRDVFDFFGPFYWDSWPSLTGAIGMTYETDGGGWKGIQWKRGDGSILSFRDGIAKHYVTAMATIQATAERRRERVRDYLAFRQGAINAGRAGTIKRVVFASGADPARAAALAATLLRSGIEVRRVTAAFTSASAHAFADDASGTRRFDAGAYVVDLAQPQGRLARAFLEPSPAFDTGFVRVQLEKFQRNQRRGANADREGYEFYDVTAWSLPVAFGVEAWWTGDAPAVQGEALTLPDSASAAARTVAGEALPVEIPRGVTGGARATSAYLFTPERDGASRLAYQLLAEGFRVGASVQPVDAGGRRWPRGTYIVRVARNDTTLHARIDALARTSGVEVAAVNTAFTDAGQFGIGSEAVYDLEAPKVALVGGEGISQTGYGALWWTLAQRYGVKFTPIAIGSLGGDISRFNVVIVPDASTGALSEQLGKSGAAALRGWVERGGTLITMGGASVWAAGEDVNLTSARIYKPDTTAKAGADTTARADSAPGRPRAGTDTATARQRRRETTSDRSRDLLAVTSPSASPDAPAPLAGSHFDVVLDRTHWLTHGYEEPRLTVMVDGNRFFKLSKEGTNVAVFPNEGKLHRAGFAFPGNTERLMRNMALMIHEPVGSGHVIVFGNEPMFRAWWRALDRLVLNGIVLGPGM
jgi:hypothetical protein